MLLSCRWSEPVEGGLQPARCEVVPVATGVTGTLPHGGAAFLQWGRGIRSLTSLLSLPARLPRAVAGSGRPRPPRCEGV